MYGEQIYRGVIVNHNEINHVLVCYLLGLPMGPANIYNVYSHGLVHSFQEIQLHCLTVH